MIRKGILVVTFVLLLILSSSMLLSHARSIRASVNYSGCGGELAPIVNANFEQRVVELVNEARAENGNLPPLKRIEELDQAARYHSVDMGQDNYAGHTTFDRINGDLVYICDTWERIATFYSGALGENIAAGQNGTIGATPEGAMEMWMDSPGHRAAILDRDSWEIGVGYFYQASGSSFNHYWTQNFGQRQGAGFYPLVINRELGQSTTAVVSLYVYGKDVYGTLTAQEMRFRNENGNWSPWQPYQEEVDWTLSAGDGVKTVYSQIMRYGETFSASDTIILNEANPLPPTLSTNTNQLTFVYNANSSSLLNHQFSINNLGSGQIDWSISKLSSADWLTLSQNNGSVVRGDSQWLSATVDPTGMSEGVYSTVVQIDGGAVSGSPVLLPVTFLYTNKPPVYLPIVIKP